MAWSGTPPNPPTDPRSLALEKEARSRVGLPEERRGDAQGRTIAFWALAAAAPIVCIAVAIGLVLVQSEIVLPIAVLVLGAVLFLVGLSLNPRDRPGTR